MYSFIKGVIKQVTNLTIRRTIVSVLRPNNSGGWGFAIFRVICILTVVVMTSRAEASSIDVSFGVNTIHLNSDNMNEENDFISIEYSVDNSDWGYIASKFVNSYENNTVALGMSYDIVTYDIIELDLLLGVMKGYKEEDLGDVICPLGEESDLCWFIAPRIIIPIYKNNYFEIKVSSLLLGDALSTSVGLEYKF